MSKFKQIFLGVVSTLVMMPLTVASAKIYESEKQVVVRK